MDFIVATTPPPIQTAVEELGRFLACAPFAAYTTGERSPDRVFNQHILGNGEAISCVVWNGSHFITLTDIERVVTARLYAIGRQVVDRRKLQEIITSFLRNLKVNSGYILEHSKVSTLLLERRVS